ncbi:hypothetical protein Plo01_21140 [Planobispora longispora]|uniref:Uncharacterized protein n=1 Tax=Planobispora longispora TaxID=28887 RepID=A0A8J3RJ99_9ACTN|nr:hypothetical protein Plo01_21140 [Planobispora longispora]
MSFRTLDGWARGAPARRDRSARPWPRGGRTGGTHRAYGGGALRREVTTGTAPAARRPEAGRRR